MGLVDRFRMGKHLKVMRQGAQAPAAALSEAKNALREMGASALPALFEMLPDRNAAGPAREVLESLLTDDTLENYIDAISQAAERYRLNNNGRFPEEIQELVETSEGGIQYLKVAEPPVDTTS